MLNQDLQNTRIQIDTQENTWIILQMEKKIVKLKNDAWLKSLEKFIERNFIHQSCCFSHSL